MISKIKKLLCGIFFICLPTYIYGKLTTMQSWDPIPFYNASNLNMPPDTQFCYLIKKRLLNEKDEKRRWVGLTISPFVQRAIKAQGPNNTYFGISNTSVGLPGQQMSDYQGTPFIMGLFLGQDRNGNSIWGGPTAVDTGNVNDITYDNVTATLLPPALQQAVFAINNISPSLPTAGPNAIIYWQPTQIDPETNSGLSPSIFSQSVLEADTKFFGAFSTPMSYQKGGFRWEVNVDLSTDFGLLARGGVCQLMQQVTSPVPLSGLAPNPLNSSEGYQATGNSLTTGIPPSIYGGLNIKQGAESNRPPVQIAQYTFNEYISNNLQELFNSSTGLDLNYQTYQNAGLEDLQLLGFWRHPFVVHPADQNKYPSLIITPYVLGGAMVPLAPIQDYSKLYALPLGNNGHIALGATAGVTFDLIESIEFGFEFGATSFLENTIYQMPCPNHILQRGLYPYKEDMIVKPGCNGQFAFIFNAFEFAHNTTFSFRYDYVQHTQDTYTLVNYNPYSLPSQLEIQSPWTSQMFIASLVFQLTPNIALSGAWQGALSQRNAYCSNTIMASLSCVF